MIWGSLIILSLIHLYLCDFTLVGMIKFKDGDLPERVPDNSWLTVKVEDTSIMDVASVSLGSTTVPVQNYTKSNDGIKFRVENIKYAKVPEISVSAVLNMGWKPNGDKWLQKGDYLSDITHRLDDIEDKSTVTKDVEVRKYGD
ncbi:uncharacterized protein [Clytia hemisphaerica]|uniref:Cnidarian restricted protein n=1 Tax=Clytia hemisphaerica TaxID=252671 RepID=A0A7M5X6X1_9CNID